MKFTTLDDYALWQLEAKLVTDHLDRIERAEREILLAIGCPTKPAAIYRILSGEDPEPWGKQTAKRDRLRAKLAMHAIVRASEVRRYLGPDETTENPRLAAHAALLLGAFAGDLVVQAENASLGARQRRLKKGASLKAAAARAQRAAQWDDRYRREATLLRERHPYSRREHSTRWLAHQIALKLRRDESTVRARLTALGLR
jgi:hypothetical protein